jgi:hypothetical protein
LQEIEIIKWKKKKEKSFTNKLLGQIKKINSHISQKQSEKSDE